MLIREKHTQVGLATLVCLWALSACVPRGDRGGRGGAQGGDEAGAMAGIQAGVMTGGEAGALAGGEAGLDSAWSVYEHPCSGNRTDALHCDDARVCFVGCGTTTNGRGLFVTYDGGESWAPLEASPPTFLEEARVNDISRSSDGRSVRCH